MKVLICLIVIFAVLVQIEAAITDEVRERGERFRACMRELKLNVRSERLKTNFVCLRVCEHEKIGWMIEGKYQVEKYIDGYVKLFPKAGPVQVSTMIKCLNEANKQANKCDVGRALQKCEMSNYNLLYIETKDYLWCAIDEQLTLLFYKNINMT